MTELLVHAKNLTSTTRHGTIFGPLDLDLEPRQLGIVRGDKGSGKSALLLALTGRFKRTRGTLVIDGVDAIANPYEAMARTSVARLADYVQPEDRLTLEESIVERCYLDGCPVKQGRRRVHEIEELLGYTVDHSCELEQLSPIEHAVVSVALAMLRPSKVIVLDDADAMVPHRLQRTLFELLARLTEIDDSTIIAATVDDDSVPDGAVEVALPRPAALLVSAPTKILDLPRASVRDRGESGDAHGDGVVPDGPRIPAPGGLESVILPPRTVLKGARHGDPGASGGNRPTGRGAPDGGSGSRGTTDAGPSGTDRPSTNE